MNLIAIENAANGASVALLQELSEQDLPVSHASQLARIDDRIRVLCQLSDGEGKNAEQVLPMLDTLLAEAGLSKQSINGVVFSQGPGGFTGLRVACGLAQGLALGLHIPAIPVSSLQASAFLSQHFLQEGIIVVALDARMQEVYLAAYIVKQGRVLPQAILSPLLMQAKDVLSWVQQQLPRWCLLQGWQQQELMVCLAGNAASVYPEYFVLPDTGWCIGETAWANADTLVRVAYQNIKEGRFSLQSLNNLDSLVPLYLRDKVAFTTEERASGQGGNPQIALPVLTPLEQQQQEFVNELLQTKYWIRPLKRSDLPAVMAIEQQTQLSPWSEGMFFAAFMHVNYYNWALIDADNQIVAYAVQLVEPDVVNLMTISVVPALQGKGLGKCLLKWLELFIASREGPHRQLLEVRVSNSAARALYESMGYQQIGLRKEYYATANGREDALVLQKNITFTHS